MQEALIVVPCFNEAARLRWPSFDEALAAQPGLSLLFVNDGSSDETAAMLDGFCDINGDRAQVLHCVKNRGKAEAVRLGVLRALDSDFSVVGYFDADLAAPLSELPGMLSAFGAAPTYAIFGSRVSLLGKHVERSAMRHYAGRLFATAASSLLRLRVYDTQCGAKLFLNCSGVREAFTRSFMVNWTFDVELLARFAELGRAGKLPLVEVGVREYPLQYWADIAGSKLQATDAVRAGLELARLWSRYR